MLKKKSITIETAHELLDYNPTTGVFRWKKSRRGTVRAGSVAGSIANRRYRRIKIDDEIYATHRLAWFYMTGEWPKDQIDHIDGDCLNDSFENLREATQSQNQMNRRCFRTNKLGFKGVIETSPGRFRAKLDINKKRIHLGFFDSAEAAFAARSVAVQKFHGEFARA